MLWKLVFYDNLFVVFFLLIKVIWIDIVFVVINYIWVYEDINIILVKWIDCFRNEEYEFYRWFEVVLFVEDIEDIYDDYYGKWIIDKVFNVYGMLLV